MPDNWIIEVLADLRKYAINNSMAKLVEQLDDTIHIAACEMTQDAGEDTVRIPEYPATRTDNIRPPKPGYPATCGLLH